jgi:SNF2 family DNA or RNA helicase
MLRRTKAEVLHDLPPLMETTLKVDEKTGTVAERNALIKADDSILDLLSRGHSLTSGDGIGAVQNLRVLAGKQKIPATVEYLRALGATRVVVFCLFREIMNELQAKLEEDSEVEAPVAQIHGDVDEGGRADVLRAFTRAEAFTLLIQQGVGGTGLDGLQVASTGIIHDLPWTHDELNQVTSRLHRQGQHDSVHMVTMLSTSVIEERLLRAIREGKELHEVMYE